MGLSDKRSYDSVTLQAAAVKTATGNGTAVRMPGFAQNVTAFIFELDVTAAATVAADTLDVFVQTKIDGTNWLDVVHFTQVLGDGGAKRYLLKASSFGNVTGFEAGAALNVNASRHIVGDDWRVRWVVVNDTGPSFTFSVTACPM